jgi:hypothetical protein
LNTRLSEERRELTGAEEGCGGAELDSAQGRGEGVAEAGVRKDGARAVLFIGSRAGKRPKASWRRRGMPQRRWGRTALGTRPLGQAASTVS